jgi:hypothetical protein
MRELPNLIQKIKENGPKISKVLFVCFLVTQNIDKMNNSHFFLANTLELPKVNHEKVQYYLDVFEEENGYEELKKSYDRINAKVTVGQDLSNHNQHVKEITSLLKDSALFLHHLKSAGFCMFKGHFAIATKISKLFKTVPRICFLFESKIFVIKESFGSFIKQSRKQWALDFVVYNYQSVFKMPTEGEGFFSLSRSLGQFYC